MLGSFLDLVRNASASIDGWTFALLVSASWLLTTFATRMLRGRFFAYFVAVVLGIETLSFAGLFAGGPYMALALVFHALVIAHFLLLSRPAMRGPLFRVLVSWPASVFLAGTWLALPWAIARAFDVELPWPSLPFALASLGLLQSLGAREEVVDLVVGEGATQSAKLERAKKDSRRVERPLRIVQVTDPHLGPFMSVAALASICKRAVEREPDLILLTGDFLTMESQQDARHLLEALAPLKAARGKTFACLGNHDHEAPRIVREALAANGITLLVDEETCVSTTSIGPVQIVGADFAFREKATRVPALAARYPRREGHLRLFLLHHPGHIAFLPEGDADLVLSGHTHGGQLGLVSFGLPGTIVSLLSKIPDHGAWARGRDRLYVHRGTCHYGFPIRLGVPAERSLLQVHPIN